MFKNGLNIIKSNNGIAEVRIYFASGAKYEDSTQAGISHLMEHLMCKSFDELLPEYKRKGIKWNAFTGHDVVCYHIRGLESIVLEYATDFIDRILNYELDEDDFNKEKKIVIEELVSYQSENLFVLYHNTMGDMYNYYGAGGRVEIVNDFTFEDAKVFLDKMMDSLHSIVFCVKDTDLDINANFEFNGTMDIEDSFDIDSTKDMVNTFPDLPYTKNEDELTYVLMSSYPVLAKHANAMRIIRDMTANDIISVLVQEIREKRGLTYSIECDLDKTDKNCFANIAFKTKESFEEIEKILNECLIDNYAEYFTEELFNNVKEGIIIDRQINKEENKFDSKYFHPTYNLETIENVEFSDVINLLELGIFKNGKISNMRV